MQEGDSLWASVARFGISIEELQQANNINAPVQVIGWGGATGRTTGPHLHWEVWVGGVQVDPQDWLTCAHP